MIPCFTKFFENLKKAGEAGREYARNLDAQFEGKLSLSIKESEARLKVADLKVKQVQAKTKAELKVLAKRKLQKMANNPQQLRGIFFAVVLQNYCTKLYHM